MIISFLLFSLHLVRIRLQTATLKYNLQLALAQSGNFSHIWFLLKRLEIAEVVDQSQQKNHDQVFFGATVTYVNKVGDEKTIRIVGVDEARLEFSEVSWVSPIARALLTAWEGDIVKVRTPNGLEEIEVVEISYP